MDHKEHEVTPDERGKEPPAASASRKASANAPAVAADMQHPFDGETQICLAHVLMLERQQIITRAGAAPIVQTLLGLRGQGPAVLDIGDQHEDLYSYVENCIVKNLSCEADGRPHPASGRDDVLATVWRLALRTRLIALLEDINRLRGPVLKRAREHAGTVMPNDTQGEQAQALSLGYYLLTMADLLARDYERVRSTLEHADMCPLGAGAWINAGIAIDREFTCGLLGFAQVMEIACDGVSQCDDAQEAAAACAVLMAGLSRLATDLQLWNAAEHVKAQTLKVTGTLNAVLAETHLRDRAGATALKALNAPVLEAVDAARHALAAMDGALNTLTVKPRHVLQQADASVANRVLRRTLRLGKDCDAVAAIQARVADAATRLRAAAQALAAG